MALIFVIDDEPLVLDLTCAVLRREGHEVRGFGDPVSGCDAVIAAIPKIELLLTDTDMKPMSGFQVVTKIRKEHIDCPVIFISGHHGFSALITDAFGRWAAIEKPFTAVTLRKTVNAVLRMSKRDEPR